MNQQVLPGIYALNDYDFMAPKKDLLTSSSIIREHDKADFEVYDYPGKYWEKAQGDVLARLRIEEQQAQHEIIRGEANALGLATGSLFTLTDFPREDQNREYLVISTNIQLRSNEYETVKNLSDEPVFTCSFTAMDAQQPYRSPRTTPKPVMQGPQTATVVGKSGEEIWTDGIRPGQMSIPLGPLWQLR